MKLTKSCINYTGGKYRLLKQLLPLFPCEINNFVDLFCGGCNVALNVDAKQQILCNDLEKELINLFQFLKNTEINDLIENIDVLIDEYGLSNTFKRGYDFYNCNSSQGLSKYNKDAYFQLRDDFNNNNFNKKSKYLYFYTLILFSFNNQIRFNKKGFFNVPVGKRDFNKNSRNNLTNFLEKIKNKNINFTSTDFRKVKLDKLDDDDFIYLDPPYLITLASYNEQNGWMENDEKDLLNLLDYLNSKNIKFALSNVLKSKGKTNNILLDWCKQYNANYLNYSYSNSNYQLKNKNKNKAIEVLITNY
ncbi:MAG: DNA adenine methylase [Methanobrevibacter sp.]|nr:DNA adenine methylase [Candidatus Methanoflexus mossambicus]